MLNKNVDTILIYLTETRWNPWNRTPPQPEEPGDFPSKDSYLTAKSLIFNRTYWLPWFM
jgi:hypothetical protein